MCFVFGWIFTFLIVGAAIMGLFGGYLYLTSRGNSEKITQANKTFVYVVIGVFAALFARGFPVLLGNLIGADPTAVHSC